MVYSFQFRNFTEAYYELIYNMKVDGVRRDSRNGPVRVFKYPVGLTITHPEERVLFDDVRDANPFFHLLESVWMLSGEEDVGWLTRFNARMADYAEPDGILRGAYGRRWRYHFGYDQLLWAVTELKRDPTSRRVVISMWDQGYDTIGAPRGARDLPCNTHIYLRIEFEKLAFTVCNRSNDMIWGMLGANAVHMTVLQEVLARAIGVGVGPYTVFTNNLHIYENMPRFEQIMNTIGPDDRYYTAPVKPYEIRHNDLLGFLSECSAFVRGHWQFIQNSWLANVVTPVYRAYFDRTEKALDLIEADDWRLACKEWISRRVTSSSATSMEQLPSITTEPTFSKEAVIPITTGSPTLTPAEATLPTTTSSNSSQSYTTPESESTSSPVGLNDAG